MRVFLLRKDYSGTGIYPLSQKERNYLFRVLRLSVNDVFTAKDSQEHYYKAFLFDENTITLEETAEPVLPIRDLSPLSTPSFPCLRARRMKWR